MNAIELTNVTKDYKLYDRNIVDRFRDTFLPGTSKHIRNFQALNNISLNIKQGDILGIVGRNGAGKSTLLKIIAGITKPTSGEVHVNGKVVALLELGGGFNPEYTGKENVYFLCSLQGMQREQIDEVYREIVEFSELEDFMDVPVKRYSSGMRSRLGFATSINIDPDILILDEVLAVGDELFRRKCYARMMELFESGKTILYVSHAIDSVKKLCNKGVLLHNGSMLLTGSVDTIILGYQKVLSGGLDIGNAKDFESSIERQNKKRVERESVARVGINASDGFTEMFDPSLESTSIKEKKIKDIAIEDIRLTNSQGSDVNRLLWGTTYTISASITFNEEVNNAAISAVITDHLGHEVGGIVVPNNLRSIPYVAAGTSFTFTTSFHAYLHDGLYGLRCIVRAVIDEEVVGASVVSDAVVFRCSGSRSRIAQCSIFEEGAIVNE